MVFTSVPLYLDPPNWNNNNQQQQQVQVQQQQQLSSHGGGHLFPSAVGGGGGGSGLEAHHHHHQHQPQQQQQQQMSALMAPPRPPDGSSMGLGSGAVAGGGASGGGGAGTAAVKAGSMTDRARMAKLPAPEARLKCPRCESSNTKFCYFNNYSLSQPRYFCKACRRYWTQGGTLRNVPVGGGCRRNKRTKSSKSSSSSSASAAAAAGGTGNNTASSSATTSSATTGGIMPPGAALGQMPFFAASLVSGGGEHYGGGGLSGASRGLGFPGMMSSQLDPAVDHYHHQLAAGGGGMVGMDQQWRLPPQMQQFPFFGGRATADAISGMQAQLQQQMPAGINNYPFEPDAGEGFAAGQMMGGGGGKQVPGSAGLITQLASVKMEDNPPAMAREFLGLPAAGSLQFWAGGNGGGNNGGSGVGSGGAGAQGGGGGWVDNLSGFNSSSSGNIL